LPADYQTTRKGREYLDGKIVVKSVDLSRLKEGVAAIEIENRTDEFLTDLAYEITLYYKNRDPDSTERAVMPYVPETTKKKRIDLEASERAVLTVKKGLLSPGATDVHLRLRTEKPEPTRRGDTFMSDRLRVVEIDRDWFAKPPTVKFTVRNEWESPLRLQFKVLLVKDGKVMAETKWLRGPGIMAPGARAVLEPDLTGLNVIGTLPALKVKRPRI
jgi:hypothetical protein